VRQLISGPAIANAWVINREGRLMRAVHLFEIFVEKIRDKGVAVKTGQFRAMMDVALINDGPVTLILDSNHS